MSKKDYIWLASVLREERQGCIADGCKLEAIAVERVADRLVHRLQEDNPRFDTARFMAAVLKD